MQAGAEGDPNAMVAAADELKPKLHAARAAGVSVTLTGASGMWSDFNTANRTAMMKSELFTWPVTLAILVLAFGSLVAAGLPLMLTILGLVAAAGLLSLLTHGFEVSIWAMNFALCSRSRSASTTPSSSSTASAAPTSARKLDARDAVAVTMDTAGKAVLFSGVTVLISLSAVMLVPSPAFRSMALGIMLASLFVLAATLTLLPAVLAKLGPRVNTLPLRWVHSGEHRSPRVRRLGRAALAAPARLRACGDARARPARPAGPRAEDRHALDQGRAEAATPRASATRRSSRRSAPAPRARCRSSARGESAAAVATLARRDPGIAAVSAAAAGRQRARADPGDPERGPVDPAVGRTIDRLRAALPTRTLVGGAAAENHDLEQALAAKTPLVIGVVLALGFLLLLVALQAPLIAALGVATNLLATGAAFGVARLIFQDGHGAGLLGFEPQGFLDAWGPVFFFAMIFAISMDYTVFLLSSAKEHWDRTRRPERGMDRRPRPLRPRDLRRRGGHGRGVLHLRPLRAAAAQGDGRHPRRRRPARRGARPADPAPGAAAADRPRGLGARRAGSAVSCPT